MQATSSKEPLKLALPFVARKREVAQLQRLHAQRKHVLILGPAGVGKTALVGRLRESLRLRVCPASERPGEICHWLERELELEPAELHLVRRKARLLKSLAGSNRAVVFDGVNWTTPKLSSFLDAVSERVPVWICARSERARDIGHFWPFLWKFERVELHPFHPAETLALVEAAVKTSKISSAALDASARLHQLSAGNPQVLCELLVGLAGGGYDPHRSFDLKLLDLDRRIRQLPASETFHPLER